MTIGLTKRQADALRFIQGHIEATGRTPTLDAAAKGIGYSCRGARICNLVEALQERGRIRRQRDYSIEVLAPIPIPRSPSGEPLYFVEVGQ